MSNATLTKAIDHQGKRRVFVTGSADGLGYAAAESLLELWHEVIVHVRSSARLSAVRSLNSSCNPN